MSKWRRLNVATLRRRLGPQSRSCRVGLRCRVLNKVQCGMYYHRVRRSTSTAVRRVCGPGVDIVRCGSRVLLRRIMMLAFMTGLLPFRLAFCRCRSVQDFCKGVVRA